MKNGAIVLVASCAILALFGAYGVFDGPYIGAEYQEGDTGPIVAKVAPGSPAAQAGFPKGARLVSIDGVDVGRWDLQDDVDVIPDRASLLSNLRAQARLGLALRPGQTATYRFETASGETAEHQVRPTRMPASVGLARLARLFIPAAFCLAIALAVMIKKPRDKRAKLFFAMLIATSLVFVTFGSWSSRDTTMRPLFFFPLFVINDLFAFPYFPVLFLRFCLSFPNDLGIARKRGAMAALLLSPLPMLAVFEPRLLFESQQLLWALGLLGGAVAMAFQYFKLSTPAARAQVKWILWGSTIFGISMALVYSFPILLRQPGGTASWLIPSLLFLVVPLSFAFAIFRYHLMDIDALFDATPFIYTLTAGFLLGIDALVSFALGLLSGEGEFSILSSSLAILVAILFYIPIRNRVALVVKRVFRREIYETAEVASRMADRLLLARDSSESLEALRDALEAALHPLSIAASAFAPGIQVPASFYGEGREWARAVVRAGYPNRIEGAPSTDRGETTAAAAPGPGPRAPFILDGLVDEGTIPKALSGGLAVPLHSKGELAALLTLGPKSSRNYYSSADLRLIAMLARQTALSLEGDLLRLEAEKAARELHGERERVAREMHDGVGGMLSNAIMLAGLAKAEPDQKRLAGRLETLEELLVEALADLRNLVWALHEDSASVADLASHLRERFEKATANRDVDARFRSDIGEKAKGAELLLNARERLNLVRAAQELVTNGLKHASAKSLGLSLEVNGEALVLRYADDGVGFDAEANKRGYGLGNLEKRCKEIGASVKIESAPGRGCSYSISLPLGAPMETASRGPPPPPPSVS